MNAGLTACLCRAYVPGGVAHVFAKRLPPHDAAGALPSVAGLFPCLANSLPLTYPSLAVFAACPAGKRRGSRQNKIITAAVVIITSLICVSRHTLLNKILLNRRNSRDASSSVQQSTALSLTQWMAEGRIMRRRASPKAFANIEKWLKDGSTDCYATHVHQPIPTCHDFHHLLYVHIFSRSAQSRPLGTFPMICSLRNCFCPIMDKFEN